MKVNFDELKRLLPVQEFAELKEGVRRVFARFSQDKANRRLSKRQKRHVLLAQPV